VLKSLLGLKLWEKKQLARPHSRRIFMTSPCHHCLKLVGLDRVSFDAIMDANHHVN